MIKPVYEELSTKYTGKIAFGKVDIDDNSEAASEAGVRSVPTFVFRGAADGEIEQFAGADKNLLVSKLEGLLK